MKIEALRMERVTRVIDGITKLDNLNLHIFKGEIMGVLCLNAQGQDDLIDIIRRNHPIETGYIYMNDQLVNSFAYSNMNRNPAAVLEEANSLVENLTIADNILVMRRSFKKYLLNEGVINRAVDSFFQDISEFDIHLNVGDLSQNLSYFERSAVELLKAVISGQKIIIVRDISNFISTEDLNKFHRLLRYYAAKGVTFIYMCNHHEESFTICDRAALMENGKIRKIIDKENFNDAAIAPFTLDVYLKKIPANKNISNENILEFQNIETEQINNLSFHAKKGECIVLLDTNNKIIPDIIHLMSASIEASSGRILVDGCPVNQRRQLFREVAIIKDNPVKTMVFPSLSYIDNLCFLLDMKFPFLNRMARIKKSVYKEYYPLVGADILCRDVNKLSLFSLYNIVYYRIHLLKPKVVFCVQPFSGADMYLRNHIINLIQMLKKKGITIVILAVSISDSLRVADRLQLIRNGQAVEQYNRGEFDNFNRNAP